MRAVVLAEGTLSLDTEHALPEPAQGEVLVRVLQAGICETDLQLARGYMGFQGVLGHEFVGIAEDGPLEGERVVGEINCSCGRCPTCQSGLPTHCPQRTVLGILNHEGAFADYLSLPSRNLHWVPDEIPTEQAVFVEPLAAAFQIPAQVPLSNDLKVLLLGDGRLGILCSQVIQQFGCRLTTVGKHTDKLKLLEQLGIDTIHLDDLVPARDADIVVDCTGSKTGLPLAIQCVRPRGTVVVKTTVVDDVSMNWAPLVIDELTLIGSRCGPFPEAIDALKSKQIDVQPLISASFPLDDALSAFDRARSGNALKVLLNVSNR